MYENKLRTLLLFSGQKDSVNIVINYARKHSDIEISLVYIKNIGYRPENCTPNKLARDLSKTYLNIKSLFIVDGGKIQTELVKNTSLHFNLNNINHLCILCQFSINYIYSLLAQKVAIDTIVSQSDVFGAAPSEVLNIPYNIYKLQQKSYKEYQIKNEYLDSLEFSENRCLLSYTHNYDIKYKTQDLKKIKEILTVFIKNANYFLDYTEIKLNS